MKTLTLINRRGWSLLLAVLTLFAATLPAEASWQCLNGRPCAKSCPMLHPASAAMSCCASTKAVHCSHCSGAPKVFASHEVVSLCPFAQCVLRVQTKPDASLTGKSVFVLPLLALPPPVIGIAPPEEKALAVTFARPLPFYPQRFLRPHLGRAPPRFPV